MQVNNLIEVFERSAQALKGKTCFRFAENGAWHSLTWDEVRSRVISVAGGLRKLGVKNGTRVCILSKTRYEWTLADLGIMSAGGITVPIYESNIADQVKFIIQDSGAAAIFVEDRNQYLKIMSVQDELPALKHVICFESLKGHKGPQGVYSLEELMHDLSENGEAVYRQTIKNTHLADDASFVYTSGTTGNPKGAILTHENFLAELTAIAKIFKFKPYYESLLFLPLAHILARVVQFAQFYSRFIQCYAVGLDKILEDVQSVRPHFMASVPRIFEKIHTRTLQNVAAGSPVKRRIFEWAMSVGREHSRLVLNRQKPGLLLRLKYLMAYSLVFKKLHQKLGGRILFFISGGAPLSIEVAQFFHVFGFTILEGYGLTETTAAVSLNGPNDLKPGTVGKPVENTEIKIADDGEILIRGKLVFREYYKNPQATRESFNSGGWFHSGDIGEFDAEGFLKITDRKKDIIVTAAGKNIAPQNIENLLREDPYIFQVVVHGDRRKFLSALITLDRDEIQKYAKEHNISFRGYPELVRQESVYEFIRKRIEDKNGRLARYENIKKFAILPEDFTVENGELTPTLKVRRKIISEKYQNILDSFYQE